MNKHHSKPRASISTPPIEEGCFWLCLTLDASLSRRRQTRFARRMARHLKSLGLADAHGVKLHLIAGLGGPIEPGDRGEVVAWLIDQPEVREIVLSRMTSLSEFIAGAEQVELSDSAAPQQAVTRSALRHLFHRLARDILTLQAAASTGSAR